MNFVFCSLHLLMCFVSVHHCHFCEFCGQQTDEVVCSYLCIFILMQPLVLDQEFHVLGQQKLTDLRDKIVCVADHIAVGEFSENPNQQPDILTKVTMLTCPRDLAGMSMLHAVSKQLAAWAWVQITVLVDTTNTLSVPLPSLHKSTQHHTYTLSLQPDAKGI